jgi:hypothetical protein
MTDEDLRNLRAMLETRRSSSIEIIQKFPSPARFGSSSEELLVVVREAMAWRAAVRSQSHEPFTTIHVLPGAALRLLLEPTELVSETTGPVEVRLWKGLTNRGTDVAAFIMAIGSQSPEFDAEVGALLRSTEPPPIVESPL